MGSNKKIGLSHEMGLIDTPPFVDFCLYFGDNVHGDKFSNT